MADRGPRHHNPSQSAYKLAVTSRRNAPALGFAWRFPEFHAAPCFLYSTRRDLVCITRQDAYMLPTVLTMPCRPRDGRIIILNPLSFGRAPLLIHWSKATLIRLGRRGDPHEKGIYGTSSSPVFGGPRHHSAFNSLLWPRSTSAGRLRETYKRRNTSYQHHRITGIPHFDGCPIVAANESAENSQGSR